MSRRNATESDLLGRMPRHRARGRSPHRLAVPPPNEQAEGPVGGQPEAPPTDGIAAAATAQEGVRMAAEVADIGLTAAALLMRQLLAQLESGDASAGADSVDSR